MSLESINSEQLGGFLQVLQQRLSELDKELKLPSNKRRIEREIEFDRRMIIQSINAIQRYKTAGEIRNSSIKNNLFGLETPKLFAQFLEELEAQHLPTQQEPGVAASKEDLAQSIPETGSMQEIPPAPAFISESKEQPPAQVTGVEAGPVKAPAPTTPAKLQEPVVEETVSAEPIVPQETVIEPSVPAIQETKELVEVAPGAAEIAVPQPEKAPEEALEELAASPVLQPEEEAAAITAPPTTSEPPIQVVEAQPPQPPLISEAPFIMPVAEHEAAEEETAALPEEPGVPWNGTPRVGNILKGQESAYQLEANLGVGKYGEAWKALVIESNQEGLQGETVVLKIASPGLTVEEKQQFEAEINVLNKLKNHLPENFLRVGGKLLVPEVFEAVLNPAAPPQRTFFTQSLATGQPIDEIRRRMNRIPEPEALEITAQFCRVLQALHEGLQAALPGFHPENIYWDEPERRILVVDWKHVSKQEQANFASDVISAASELYRMVMGIPAPTPGSRRALAEPLESWSELSLGIQDILMHAFDPFRPYRSARELREDLEWLEEWWQRPGHESLVHVKDLCNTLPEAEQLLEKKHAEQLRKALWGAGVLKKLAISPENEGQPWVLEFQELSNLISQWQSGAYWLEKGQKSYQSRSWDLADQDFSRALADARFSLKATRWLQAVKAARTKEASHEVITPADITRIDEAMNFLQMGKFAEAAPLFEELAGEPAQQDFGVLASEARLQESLQRVPGLLEGKQYKELAEVYQNAIEWMGKLPPGFQDILKPGFEDFELRRREYASRYKKFQELQEKVNQLKAAQTREFSEYYRKLAELFDHQPGDVDLLKQGKEQVYQLLSQGKFPEGRALAALCLDYGREADPYLHQVWIYASQLERSWQAWSRGNGPAFRNALLNQAWPSDLWANLVEKILEKSLELPGQYFVAEFLNEILSASSIRYSNSAIQEQLNGEKARILSKIEQAFQWDEEAGTEFLVNLIQEHPYNLLLFNEAAAKVELMLQHKNFSAALTIAQAAVSQFSILDLQGDKESVANVLNLLRSFLNSAVRILPLQKAWLTNGAVSLAQQLEEDNPWREGARWDDEELVFLRDFLTWCMEKLKKKDFVGWNLVLTQINPDDVLYQRLADKREELRQEFQDSIRKHLQDDPLAELENLRVLGIRYPFDPILDQICLEVLDHDFLFKDEYAEKAHKIFNKLSGYSQTLKERIGLCARYAQYFRMSPDDFEGASRELLSKLSEPKKQDQLTEEKTAFLEAVHLSWFKKALENKDLAALQAVYAQLPKEKWSKAEVESLSDLRRFYTQKVQSLADSTAAALENGEQIEQRPVGLAAKLMKNLQKQPDVDETLLEWDGLINDLRIWIQKTRQAGWNDESFRLESYLEKLTRLYGRLELLTARKISDTNLVLIAELWKLALPGTPEDPQGDPKETPKATDDNRRMWLLQMDKACQELLKNFPKDSQRQVWLSWQSRIQAELRKL